MAKTKKEYDPSKINGLSIYHDSKHTIYAPFFSSKGYILTKGNIHAYITYVEGYLVAPIAFIVAYIIWRKIWVALLAALIVIQVTILNFYLNFIRKASVIDNYERPSGDNFITRQATLEKRRLWEIIICCPILAGLIMLYSYLSGFEGATFYIMLATAIAAILYGVLHLYILLYKSRNKI
ncbi:MAG: hypothetical protein IKS51_04420 [Erysipelotrichaceae bacterium]|nr:hypothetical protein [Erysipelotrichaceae bacterium]